MSKQIRTEIVINASKEKVWSILTDFGSYSQWNPFIVSAEGQATAGSKLKNTLLNGQKKFIIRPKVISVVQGAYFDWLGSLLVKGIFDGHHYFEIEELGAGQVKLTQGEKFSGVLSGYLLKKIGDETRDNFVRMNQALKTRSESTAASI
jgi:hypothetical protein